MLSETILILIAGLCSRLAATQPVLNGIDGKTFSRSNYIQIDKFLIKNVNKLDFDAHLTQPIAHLRANKDKMSEGDIDAWNLYVALSNAGKEDTCNMEGYEMLKNNAIASELGEMRWSKDEPKFRLQNVVKTMAQRHAKVCAPVYSKMHENLVNAHRIDPKDMAMIDDLAFFSANALEQPEVVVKMFWPNFEPAEEFFRLIREADESKIVLAIDKTLSANASPEIKQLLVGNSDGKVQDHENIRQLVQSLFKKCDSYVSEFNSLYGMAGFDAATNNYPIYGSPELARGWVNFNVCKNIVQRDQEKLVAALVGHMESF